MKKSVLFFLFLFISTSFIMMFPDARAQAGNLPQHTEEELQSFDQITGFSKVDWQQRVLHTNDGVINVDSEMFLDFEHETWSWTTSSTANSTYVVHETRSIWDGSVIQYVCKNDLEDAIKCWLRGSVIGIKEYRIGVSGGIWYEELSTYASTNYMYNLSDITDYGFPILFDADTNQLVIRVSGTFNIDPIITTTAADPTFARNDVVITIGHFNYVFFKEACGGNYCIKYTYKNSSEVGWIEPRSVNRTYSVDNSYVQNQGGSSARYFPHAWKSNGTHIYGAISIKEGFCGPNPSSFCEDKNSAIGWFLFGTTTIGSTYNTTDGYYIGELVLETNASIPCLANGFGGSGACPDWSMEFNHCADGSPSASTYRSCGLDVSMNSTGFPMITYGSIAGVTKGNIYCNSFATSGCPAPIVIVVIAENPVNNGNAGCFPKGLFGLADRVACTQNDARNGKNGTWTATYQVDTYDERMTNATHIGSGNRYIWWQSQFSIDSRIWEQQTCSMGNGNMLLLKHNKSSSSVAQNQDSISAKFWYQGNASWGSEFIVHSGMIGYGVWTGRPLMLQDDMDLTCTPNAAGVMTAHVAYTTYKYNAADNATGRVQYINFTGAEMDPNTSINVRRFDKVLNVPRWALDVQIVADNSTGAIGIYYLDNYGNLFLNATGGFGSVGFSRERGLLAINQCVTLSDSTPQLSAPSDWDTRNSMSMEPFYNGTGGTTASAFITMSCNDQDTTISYYLWQNTTISSALFFYDQENTPVTITNMTFVSNYNGSILSVESCATCYASLKAGSYTVSGIFRGNADMDINGTGSSPTFYIDLANTTASFIVGNMSITFTFKDETSLHDWDVSAKPVKVDIWTTSNTKMNQTLIDETGDLQIFTSNTPARVKITFGDTYQFYRWNVSPNGCNTEGCNTALTFYLPDYTSHTVQGYTWNFADQTQQYSNGTILTRKYVSTGLIEIDHADLSVPANQIELFVILNDEYTLTAFSGDSTLRSDLGIWTAKTTTTINANIEATKLFENIKLSSKYILWDVKRTVCTAEDIANTRNNCSGIAFGGAAHSNITIYFKDIANETSTVTFEIFNSSGRVFTNTLIGNPGESTILWQGADTNISHVYWVLMTATSSRFGIISETRPASSTYNDFGPMIPLGRCPVCSGGLISNTSPYYVYLSMMILIFTIGLFSQQTAAFGGIVLSLVAVMLYIFGWLPGINPLILAFGTLMAFLYAFANSRG